MHPGARTPRTRRNDRTATGAWANRRGVPSHCRPGPRGGRRLGRWSDGQPEDLFHPIGIDLLDQGQDRRGGVRRPVLLGIGRQQLIDLLDGRSSAARAAVESVARRPSARKVQAYARSELHGRLEAIRRARSEIGPRHPTADPRADSAASRLADLAQALSASAGCSWARRMAMLARIRSCQRSGPTPRSSSTGASGSSHARWVSRPPASVLLSFGSVSTSLSPSAKRARALSRSPSSSQCSATSPIWKNLFELSSAARACSAARSRRASLRARSEGGKASARSTSVPARIGRVGDRLGEPTRPHRRRPGRSRRRLALEDSRRWCRART